MMGWLYDTMNEEARSQQSKQSVGPQVDSPLWLRSGYLRVHSSR